MNIGDICWLNGPNGKVRQAVAQGCRAAKRQKREDAEAKKLEAESAKAAWRFKFTSGEVVYLENVTAKKVNELQDTCWALGQNDEGMRDALIVTIKSQLSHPDVQNNLKFAGLYVSHCHVTNKNQSPQLPLAIPLLNRTLPLKFAWDSSGPSLYITFVLPRLIHASYAKHSFTIV